MNGQNDDSQNFALTLLAILLTVVVASVVAFGASKAMGSRAQSDTVSIPAQDDPATGAPSPTGLAGADAPPEGRIVFAPGSDALPAEAADVLVRVADAARTQGDKLIEIMIYDEGGPDAAANAGLSERRALALRHAFEANGVSAERLLVGHADASIGDSYAATARSADLRLR